MGNGEKLINSVHYFTYEEQLLLKLYRNTGGVSRITLEFQATSLYCRIRKRWLRARDRTAAAFINKLGLARVPELKLQVLKLMIVLDWGFQSN